MRTELMVITLDSVLFCAKEERMSKKRKKTEKDTFFIAWNLHRFSLLPVKHLLNIKAGVRIFYFGNFFRRSFRNNGTATEAPFRTEIDNMIGLQDDVEVMFYHQDGVSLICQPLNNFHQLFDIGKMQSRCRLIQNIKRLTRRPLGKFVRQFNPLRFAA